MSENEPKLRIHNTLTREKEVFEPLDPKNVRMYVCGPTVYDFAHIGNARPVIVFDVLFRLLRHLYGKEHVTYVRNITDVDDKINARALRDFPGLPLNDAIRNVTEKTANQFHDDVKALGCLEPSVEPRATDFVLPRGDGKADMVSLIQSLINRGHAYAAKGEILFDTTSMADYGGLSKRKLEDQRAGARVAVDDHKKNPGDFVLWKESSAEEPGWEASFNVDGKPLAIRGRPGWHIECSAMSAAFLGETFDIHGGGLDLIFPHHENEIAQSRCAHGTDMMARYWMHNGFVQVEGRKMSKSEGNFITIHDLLHTEKFGGRKWPGEVLRLAMLMTHYREPIDFWVGRLEEAERILARWKAFAHTFGDAHSNPADLDSSPELKDHLLDDLNTPMLIGHINSEIHLVRRGMRDVPGLDEQQRMIESERLIRGILAATGILGFQFKQQVTLSEEQKKLIDQRTISLREKDFAKADQIRTRLAAEGIQLMDYKDPETGERRTKWEVKG